jgi:hypothetical protein
MDCYDCGNCRLSQPVYFCIAKNEFVAVQTQPRIRQKAKGNWKKGNPNYELHRRKVKQEIDNIRGIS